MKTSRKKEKRKLQLAKASSRRKTNVLYASNDAISRLNNWIRTGDFILQSTSSIDDALLCRRVWIDIKSHTRPHRLVFTVEFARKHKRLYGVVVQMKFKDGLGEVHEVYYRDSEMHQLLQENYTRLTSVLPHDMFRTLVIQKCQMWSPLFAAWIRKAKRRMHSYLSAQARLLPEFINLVCRYF